MDWIEQNDSLTGGKRKIRVRLYYGEQFKITYYIDKDPRLQYALCQENSADWDYFIQMPAEAKYGPAWRHIVNDWPPPNTVHEITADGGPLCAIIKNPRVQPNQPVVENQPVDSSVLHINAGLRYYQNKDYNHAIVEFRRSIGMNAKNIIAYNNLVATYNQLHLFDDAIEYAQKGLAVDPNYQLLKNNLKASLDAKKGFAYTEPYWLNTSYNYYMQGDFLKSIEASHKALKLNPKNATAWNNICSAYNELKEFKKAVEACDEGLKLNATNQQIINNRKEALKSLGSQ